jgi:hypothetical protein
MGGACRRRGESGPGRLDTISENKSKGIELSFVSNEDIDSTDLGPISSSSAGFDRATCRRQSASWDVLQPTCISVPRAPPNGARDRGTAGTEMG